MTCPSPLLAALVAGDPGTAPTPILSYPPPVPGRPDAVTAPMQALHTLRTEHVPLPGGRPTTRPHSTLTTLELPQVIR